MSNPQSTERLQGLWSGLVPSAESPKPAGAARGNVLGRINLAGAPGDPVLVAGAPRLTTHTANGHVAPVEEVWRTLRPVRSGVAGGAVFAEDGEHLFYAARVGPQPVYRDRVRELYEDALRFTWERGYTDLVRMWNLIGGITSPNAEGLEIYRDFCVGRAEAFTTWSEHFPQLPAATGIGSLSPGVDLCFLAAKPGRAVHLENPRQTPAYEYPSQYGPKSPSFARATFLKDLKDLRDSRDLGDSSGQRDPEGRGTGTLFVSGTASILGDRTVHQGDVARQTEETLRNIEALVSSENLRRYGLGDAGFDVKDLGQVKVYVRDAEDVPVVRGICASAFSREADVAYFNVDVCRSDLLVEIEGVCR